jgi:hypothetical protein
MATLLKHNEAQSTDCGVLPKKATKETPFYLTCGVLILEGQKSPKLDLQK